MSFWKHKGMSNFSFSQSVFYSLEELSATFNKFEIVICKLLQLGEVKNFLFGKVLNKKLCSTLMSTFCMKHVQDAFNHQDLLLCRSNWSLTLIWFFNWSTSCRRDSSSDDILTGYKRKKPCNKKRKSSVKPAFATISFNTLPQNPNFQQPWQRTFFRTWKTEKILVTSILFSQHFPSFS